MLTTGSAGGQNENPNRNLLIDQNPQFDIGGLRFRSGVDGRHLPAWIRYSQQSRDFHMFSYDTSSELP
jgi:hypothetical protein